MLVVHVNQSWPRVQAGTIDASSAVLGEWPITEDKLDQFGDVLAAVYDNVVVDVRDITGYTRDADNKVVFDGKPSAAWAHLIGQPTPATPWGRRGDAWPVRAIDTAVAAGGDTTVQRTEHGRRAVVGSFTLTVDDHDNAVVVAPVGRSVTVHPVSDSDS